MRLCVIRSRALANPNRLNTAFPVTGPGASTTSTALFTDRLKMLSLLPNYAIITKFLSFLVPSTLLLQR